MPTQIMEAGNSRGFPPPDRVSVIIPTYNGARHLRPTIDSILAQDHPAAEVIVVNDGSTDDTLRVLAPYGPPVRVMTIDNIGVTGARAAGIGVATADWLAFCDHDDLWSPTHLSRLVGLARRHELRFLFSDFLHLRNGELASQSHFESDPSGFWRRPGRALGDDFFIAEAPLLPHVLQYQVIFPSCTLVERGFLERVGGLNPAMGRNVSEDLEFTLRCVAEAPAGIDRQPTVHIRRHETNYSADWIRGVGDAIDILKFADQHHNLPDPWRRAVRDQVRERSIYGIDLCFAQKRFGDIRRFTGNLSPREIPLKTSVKLAIARSPRFIAEPLTAALTALRTAFH